MIRRSRIIRLPCRLGALVTLVNNTKPVSDKEDRIIEGNVIATDLFESGFAFKDCFSRRIYPTLPAWFSEYSKGPAGNLEITETK